MNKTGIGWAAGVITGALAIGGITTAAVTVNHSKPIAGSNSRRYRLPDIGPMYEIKVLSETYPIYGCRKFAPPWPRVLSRL